MDGKFQVMYKSDLTSSHFESQGLIAFGFHTLTDIYSFERIFHPCGSVDTACTWGTDYTFTYPPPRTKPAGIFRCCS